MYKPTRCFSERKIFEIWTWKEVFKKPLETLPVSNGVKNIEEGYKRATTSEYLDFLGYSQGSLEEVKGDMRELTEDGFLKSRRGSSLASIGIDLGGFHQALKGDKGNYRMVQDAKGSATDYVPLNVLYPPLRSVRAEGLTYEMSMELINKTDWNLRQLAPLEKNKGVGYN